MGRLKKGNVLDIPRLFMVLHFPLLILLLLLLIFLLYLLFLLLLVFLILLLSSIIPKKNKNKQLLATASGDGYARIWDSSTNKLLSKLECTKEDLERILLFGDDNNNNNNNYNEIFENYH